MDSDAFVQSFERAVLGLEDTLDQVELKAMRLRALRASMSREIKRVETVRRVMVASGRAS